MKTCLLLALISLFGLNLHAQADENDYSSSDKEFKTIFSPAGPIKVSGFGGPMMSFGTIDGHFAHMMGGGGGVLVNNFFFGGYGMGLTTPIPYKEYNDKLNDEFDLSYGHGGFWVGYIIAPNYPIHVSISSQFGWGSIGQSYYGNDDYDDPDDLYNLNEVSLNSDVVFVITPIAEVELNFSRFFKIGVGASASLVQCIDSYYAYEQKDFLNPNVFLSFKFGWFE